MIDPDTPGDPKVVSVLGIVESFISEVQVFCGGMGWGRRQARLSVSRATRVPLNWTKVTRAIISTMATIITAVS
ncbi:hypothetical protein GCM10009674_22220 [Nesterenkonia xinjiangensis]